KRDVLQGSWAMFCCQVAAFGTDGDFVQIVIGGCKPICLWQCRQDIEHDRGSTTQAGEFGAPFTSSIADPYADYVFWGCTDSPSIAISETGSGFPGDRQRGVVEPPAFSAFGAVDFTHGFVGQINCSGAHDVFFVRVASEVYCFIDI